LVTPCRRAAISFNALAEVSKFARTVLNTYMRKIAAEISDMLLADCNLERACGLIERHPSSGVETARLQIAVR
jgi:hypothetical protein